MYTPFTYMSISKIPEDELDKFERLLGSVVFLKDANVEEPGVVMYLLFVLRLFKLWT